MKINILASSSFHVLPLAKELQSQGCDVRFYSYLSHFFTKRKGLDNSMTVSMFWFIWPFLIVEKILPSRRIDIQMLRNKLIDNYCSIFMRKADVIIALGSVYFRVFERAKKDGAISIIEWGSKHIIEQRKCFNRPDNYYPNLLRRELQSYEIADYIAIPSSQVAQTFLMHDIPREKLLVNPYGVDLVSFPPTELDMEDHYDLIAVGGWRYEKGSDLLCELCEKYKYSLLHVGSLVNMVFPQRPNMKHVDSVPQDTLTFFYKKAKVLVLPSRAEGLSLVQVQAISSGLPIVCSRETGGADLREMLDDRKWIVEMDSINVEELKRCVDEALFLANTQKGIRRYSRMDNFSWKKYGERYYANLKRITGNDI